MKSIRIISLLILGLVLYACGDKASLEEIVASGDVEAIHSKKKELTAKYRQLEKEISQLDSAIELESGNKNLPLVTALRASARRFDHYLELQGDVTTKQNVLIYPEASGILVRILVTEGQRVNKGQLLGVIDDGGMSSQLLQMKTQLSLAKTTFERQESLWKKNIGTEIQYLQSKSNYEAQQNAVAQMESQLGKFRITAPFNGILDDVIKDQGTVVSPGGPGSEIFRIINLSDMYIEVPVPETYISSIIVGKEAQVYFPVLNETIVSKIRQTGNFINPANRSFSVEIPVPNLNGLIKPNMTAKVLLNDYVNANAMMIPQSIISENAEGEQYVFVTGPADSENIAEASRKIVTTGKTQGDDVEILSGIEDGDMLIQEGARSVRSGQQVKILTQS